MTKEDVMTPWQGIMKLADVVDKLLFMTYLGEKIEDKTFQHLQDKLNELRKDHES